MSEDAKANGLDGVPKNITINVTQNVGEVQPGGKVVGVEVHLPETKYAPLGLFTIQPPPVDFVGREKELKELLREFERGATISGLTGGGGIGKTALARALAQALAERFPEARLEINLQGVPKEGQIPLEPVEAMRLLLRPFFPADTRLTEEAGELRGLYVDTFRMKRALLLLDNARDAVQVRELIPSAPSVAIVTSRRYLLLEGLTPFRLRVMAEGEARKLLLTVAPRLKKEKAETLDRLAERCGWLPLALRVAGSLLKVRGDWTVEAYLGKLVDERKRLEGLRVAGDPDLDVEATLALSYGALEDEQQARFRSLGAFPAPFELGGLAAVWGCSQEEADAGIGELLEVSLMDTAGGSWYKMHDLTRAFALERLGEQEEEARQAGERHADYYLELGSRADDLYQQGGEHVVERLGLFREAWPHLQTAWRRMAGEEEWPGLRRPEPEGAEQWLSGFPYKTTNVIDYLATAREQIPILERAEEAARGLGDKEAEGSHLNNLGSAYKNLGEMQKAIVYHEQALAIAREIGNRRGEGADLGNLGTAYEDLGET